MMSAPSTALLKSQPAPSLRSIEASLACTERPAGTAYSYTCDPPDGEPRTNTVLDERQVPIADARPIAEELSLDVKDFAMVRKPSAVHDFSDEARTLGLGHPEAAEIVSAAMGASRVVVFDHTLRERIGLERGCAPPARRPRARRPDPPLRAAAGRDIMGEEAEDLLRRRAAIISVWRPIARPARDWPLVLGDPQTIAPADLIPSELRFRHRTGETYSLAYNPAHQLRAVRAACGLPGPGDPARHIAARGHRVPHPHLFD